MTVLATNPLVMNSQQPRIPGMNASNPQVGGQMPRIPGMNASNPQAGGGARTPANPWQVGGSRLQAFGPGNDMVGQSILPSDSQSTRTATGYASGAAGALAGYNVKPFQGVQPLNLGTSTAGLNGAQGQMQGLKYDFNAAQGRLDGAAATSGAMLNGVAGMGQSAFTGGGANMANTATFNRELDGAKGFVGDPFAYSADVGRTRATTEDLFNKAAQGTDRGAIAGETLSLLEARSQPGYEQALRQVGQKNAAMGRRGSGITTNELGDVTLARERELALSRRDVANDAASRTLQDRMDLTNLGMGVTSGFGAQDIGASNQRLAQAKTLADLANDKFSGERFNAGQAESAAGRQASGAANYANTQRGVAGDLYGMGADGANFAASAERDRVGLGERQSTFSRGIANDLGNNTRDEYSAGVNERDASRADEYNTGQFLSGKLGDLSGYANGERDNDARNRDELRGERDYQYGLGRDAINDEYTRADFEERLRNGRSTRAMGNAQLGFGAPSPTSAYQDQAQRYGASAADNYGAAAGFMSDYFANRPTTQRRSGAGAGGAPAGTTGYR